MLGKKLIKDFRTEDSSGGVIARANSVRALVCDSAGIARYFCQAPAKILDT